MKPVLPLALAVLALAGCGDNSSAAVGRYCNHGAQSRAQCEGCVQHVTIEEVLRRYDRIDSGSWREDAPIYAIECSETSGDYTSRAIPGCRVDLGQ